MDPAPAPRSSAPIEVALRHLQSTHRALEGLISHSESFNYLEAKKALKQLQKEIQSLCRTKEALERVSGTQQNNIRVIDFSRGQIENPVNS